MHQPLLASFTDIVSVGRHNFPPHFPPNNYLPVPKSTDAAIHVFLSFNILIKLNLNLGIDWEVRLPTPSRLERDIQPKEHTTSTNQHLREKFNKSIANMVVMRGKDVHLADPSSFESPNLYVDWNQPSSCISIYCHQRPFNNYEKSLTLLSNSQTPVRSLNSVVEKAWNMFASRAYVHQYLKFGISEDEFVDSFASLEQVIKNYSSL